MGIFQEKFHFGFPKSSKFKFLLLMTFCIYVPNFIICHTKSRLNLKKLSVGGSLKKIWNSCPARCNDCLTNDVDVGRIDENCKYESMKKRFRK